jgi:hypothetical protein
LLALKKILEAIPSRGSEGSRVRESSIEALRGEGASMSPLRSSRFLLISAAAFGAAWATSPAGDVSFPVESEATFGLLESGMENVMHAVEAAPGGGAILAGSTANFQYEGGQVFLARIREDGGVEWAREYGRGEALSVDRIPGGGFIAAGGGRDILVLAVDESGSPLWSLAPSEDTMTYARSVRATGDGGFIVAGARNLVIGPDSDQDQALMKLDASGNIVWIEYYGDPTTSGEWDRGHDAIETRDGGYALLGSGAWGYCGVETIHVTKTDGAGVVLWDDFLDLLRPGGGIVCDTLPPMQPSGIAETEAGEIIVAGRSEFDGPIIARYSPEGALLSYVLVGDMLGSVSFRPAPDGSFLILASPGVRLTADENIEMGPSLLFEVDAGGEMAWQASILPGHHAASVLPAADGGYLVAGSRPIDGVGWYGAGTLTKLGPAEMEAPRFIRSDANDDGKTDLSDAVTILSFLFAGGGAPACAAAFDADANDRLDITDGICVLNFLFLGGASPPAPFPGCGPAPAASVLECLDSAACRM